VLGDGSNDLEYVEFLSKLWADEVDVRHEPPMAADGVYRGHDFAAKERLGHEALHRAVPDLHHEDIVVTPESRDRVAVTFTLVGTLPDGSLNRAPLRLALHVRNGTVHRVEGSTPDPAAIAALAAISVPAYD
jgi:hypothetical protein